MAEGIAHNGTRNCRRHGIAHWIIAYMAERNCVGGNQITAKLSADNCQLETKINATIIQETQNVGELGIRCIRCHWNRDE